MSYVACILEFFDSGRSTLCCTSENTERLPPRGSRESCGRQAESGTHALINGVMSKMMLQSVGILQRKGMDAKDGERERERDQGSLRHYTPAALP